MLKKVFIVSFIILCFQGVNAQSLLHSKPLDYNRGFAGTKTFDRISFHFNEIGKNSRNAYFSYDRLVKSLRGGIGIYGNRAFLKDNFTDQQGVNEKNRRELTKIGVAYSPKFIIQQKVLLSPSASMEYNHFFHQNTQGIDETDNVFLQEINDPFAATHIGILANSSKWFAGYQFSYQYMMETRSKSLHSFQAGYVYTLGPKINIMIDGVYHLGEQVDHLWRNYQKQVNVAYQYGVIFVGAGLNDYKYVSALIGVKLINLKINAAYHVLSPQNMNNVELGIQYTFDKSDNEKIDLPFRKWLLKLKM